MMDWCRWSVEEFGEDITVKAPIRDRTEDLFITNEVLCQLSYRSDRKKIQTASDTGYGREESNSELMSS